MRSVSSAGFSLAQWRRAHVTRFCDPARLGRCIRSFNGSPYATHCSAVLPSGEFPPADLIWSTNLPRWGGPMLGRKMDYWEPYRKCLRCRSVQTQHRWRPCAVNFNNAPAHRLFGWCRCSHVGCEDMSAARRLGWVDCCAAQPEFCILWLALGSRSGGQFWLTGLHGARQRGQNYFKLLGHARCPRLFMVAIAEKNPLSYLSRFPALRFYHWSGQVRNDEEASDEACRLCRNFCILWTWPSASRGAAWKGSFVCASMPILYRLVYLLLMLYISQRKLLFHSVQYKLSMRRRNWWCFSSEWHSCATLPIQLSNPNLLVAHICTHNKAIIDLYSFHHQKTI